MKSNLIKDFFLAFSQQIYSAFFKKEHILLEFSPLDLLTSP